MAPILIVLYPSCSQPQDQTLVIFHSHEMLTNSSDQNDGDITVLEGKYANCK